MNDNTPETDRQWANWLQELKNPIESFVNFTRKLERERDESRKSEMAAILERERWKMRAEEKWAMRRELEELLGVESSSPCDEQFYKGINALRQLIRERDEAREAIRAALAQQWLLDPQCAEDQALVDRLIEAARD